MKINCAMTLVGLLGMALWSSIAYVMIHFIVKFW